MIQWHIECKFSGTGHSVQGNFDDAIREAQAQCTEVWSKWVVWGEPANVRMAEVTIRGSLWVKTKLAGDEVKKLMRRHHKTIAQLAFITGITQKRIRQVRDKGLHDQHAVRDWIEAITDEDPGPLPERYRISRRDEECQCCYCGYPLFISDHAYEYANGAFCSVLCCRQSRNWAKEQAT